VTRILIISVCFAFSFLTQAPTSQAKSKDPSTRHKWDLNDVTFIYPLPINLAEDKAMIHPDEDGTMGKLLPLDAVSLFDQIVNPLVPSVYSTIRLVSMRVDPCGHRDDTDCGPQIRLVWQALGFPKTDGSAPVVGNTLFFHSFYSLTKEEFESFANDLAVILDQYSPPTKNRQLDVHPAFVRDGIASPFGTQFKNLVLKTVGMKNIHRIAAVGFNAQFHLSFFFKEFINGSWVDQTISGTTATHQSIVFKAPPPNDPISSSMSMDPSPDNVSASAKDMMGYSAKFFRDSSNEVIRGVSEELTKLQNPTIERNPNKVNCIACHLAPNVERGIRNERPDLGLFQNGFRYSNSRHNLTDMSSFGWGSTALGYQGGVLSTHPRAIADSAESADFMNRLFSGKKKHGLH
jgi:hypothetical protein